jgi:hypothetical protein
VNTTRVLRRWLALCALLLASAGGTAHADYLARAENGVRLIPMSSVPSNCTPGRLCLWYDSVSSALKFRLAGGTDLNLSNTVSVAGSAKGDIIAYSGSAWSRLAVGTNNFCLVADSAQALGVKWASCGGGGGSVDGLKAAYEAASATSQNRLLLTAALGWLEIRDNATPLTTSLRLTDSTGSWWRFYVNRYGFGSFPEAATGTVFPVMELSPPSHTALTASTESPAFYLRPGTWQWATGALSEQRWFLLEAPTLEFVGASVISDAATFAITGAPIAGTNATITRAHSLWIQSGRSTFDRASLATTTAPGLVLRNPTASTGGATVQVSPSLDFEGSSYFTTNKNTGARLYQDTVGGAPYLNFAFKTDDVSAGAWGNYGRAFPGYAYQGFSIGDAAGVNWLDFGGGASGSSAIRVVAGGASHTVFDSGGMHPYSTDSYSLGNTTEWYAESAIKHPGGGGNTPTCAVGSAAGTGATCSVSGRDAAFEITINTGTGCPTGTDDIVTVTYSSAWDIVPFSTISPSNPAGAISGYRTFIDRGGGSTTTVVLYTPFGVGLTDSSTYKYVVHSYQ